MRRPRCATELALASGAALISLLAGCGVADLDYTGKTCSAADPCPDGWDCLGSVCGRGGSSGSNCKVQPANFHVAWKTPNSIRWGWDPDRSLEPTLFGRYELRFGQGASPTGDPQLWTAEQNAELGQYRLDHTGGDDHVASTVTDGLEHDTIYWAQLVAYDNAGCAHATAVVSAMTEEEPAIGREIVLFDDDLLEGWTDPPEVQLVTNPDMAYRGSAYLAYDPICASSDCGNVPKVSGLEVPISMIEPPEDIDKTAFLELAVASSVTSDWAGALLALGPGDNDGATFEPYTLTEGTAYRLWQIPLRSIIKADGTGIGTSDLGRSVYTFGVIGNWEEGKPLRIDEVRIRW